jgi:hypothetical protein
MVTGDRKITFQVVPCPGCKTDLFILPLSPLPSPGSLAGLKPAREAQAPSVPARRVRRWLMLAAVSSVGVFTIAVLAGLAAAFLGNRATEENGSVPDATRAPEELRVHEKKAREFIASGNFRLALVQLDAVSKAQQRLGIIGRRQAQVMALRREIGLYADLLEEPLEEILEHAIRLPEAEWRLEFDRRYRGKALILDTELRPTDNELLPGYLFQVQGETVRLNLRELPVLQQLALEQPQRVLFGARLADIRRAGPGAWAVHFASDSAVLLTDPAAAAISCPPLDQARVRELLQKQKKLADGFNMP